MLKLLLFVSKFHFMLVLIIQEMTMALYNADCKRKPYFSQQKNPSTWNLFEWSR